MCWSPWRKPWASAVIDGDRGRGDKGRGKKERQNKMKRLTYRVKRPCRQRWMVGLKAGGLREIYNLCVQLPEQERSH